MFILKRAQAGFTLIEVVAAAALLGLMVTMAMPSLNAANAKVKDNRLKADLATIDQAIQLYIIDNGSVPSKLDELSPNYISKIDTIKDAKNNNFVYSGSDSTYDLKGLKTSGFYEYSNGSANIPDEPEAPEVKS